MVEYEVSMRKEEKKICFSFIEKLVKQLECLLFVLKSFLWDQMVQGATHDVKTAVAKIFFVSFTLLSTKDLSKLSRLMSRSAFLPTKEDSELKARKTINMTRRTQGITNP